MEASKKSKKKKKAIKKENLDKLNYKYKTYLNQEFPKEDTQFTDNLFQPNESSLLGLDTKGKYPHEIEMERNEIIPSEIEWKRSKKILFEPHLFEGEISIKNISTGIIINSYFISAVEALCKYPFLIEKIFITKEYNEDNCFFELLLFIDGEYQIIYLDDYFPCIKGTSVPYFTKSTSFDLWFMLLEKAWAKVKGGYGNILVGNPSEVFRFLTGFCTEQIDNKSIERNNFSDVLKNSFDSKEIICFSSKKEVDVENFGLIKDHNYVLLNIIEIKDNNNQIIFLCKLKNPIKCNENWNGDWSSESEKWTEEIRNQVNENILDCNEDEFFISIDDILKYFNRTDICHILFNSYSKTFDFNDQKKSFEPQIFNFYLENKGKVSISITEKNQIFDKSLNNICHPTSFILFKYESENLNMENIYSDFECDKDIEKTFILNEGYYFLWIYKYFQVDEIEKNMKIKLLSESNISIKNVGEDIEFQVIKYIIYQNTKLDLEKENKINNSEIIHYITNEFKDSGLAFRLAINPLSTCYQKWTIDSSDSKDFTIISPKLNPHEPFNIYLPPNNYSLIIAIRNKKYGNFIFNTKIDAEEYEDKDDSSKIQKKTNLQDFKNWFTSDRNNLEKITNKETNSFDELSKKLNFPIVDHAEIFIEKYKKKYKLIEQLLTMEQDEKNKNLRWAKIKKENGVYLGEVEQNLPQGRGLFIYNGKEGEYLQYVGYFDNGEKNNFGKLYNEEGRLIYEGEYKNGLRNGEGTYYYARGLKYEGQFVNGFREGHGIFYWDNDTRWEGPFKNNEMDGEGKYYEKGECYSVVYKNGEISE